MILQTSLIPVEYSDERVLTTDQLANFYECEVHNITKNFNSNKEKFAEGKHYFKLEGEELNKLRVTFGDLQISPMTRTLYLWTKRGAARHSKMLGTDKAWEVFETLEENYFNRQERIKFISKEEVKPSQMVMEIGAMSMALQNTFGVQKGISLLKATDAISNYYNFDLTPLKELVPPAEHEIGTLTPTEIGKQINLSPRKVNEKLVEKGLQVKDDKGYRLTDEGKKYAEAMPYTRNGHSGYQIKWTPQITTILLENVVQ